MQKYRGEDVWMTFKSRKIALFLLFFINFNISFCQTGLSPRSNLDFKILNVEEGLSHNNVFTIFQDSEGFIWIGTENGLNVYNGHEIKVFKREGKSNYEISGNEISSLAEDDNGNIWIGTFNGGICRYNKKNGTFFSIDLSKNNPSLLNSVHAIHYQNGYLWIGEETGTITRLNTSDFSTKSYVPTFDIDREVVFQDAIKAFFSDEKYVWASSNSGFLFKIDKTTDKFEILNISKKVGEVVQLIDIAEIHDGNLLFASSKGLISLDKETFEIKLEKVYQDLITHKVNDYFIDDQGNTWVLTEGIGIMFYSPRGNRLVFNKEQFKYQYIPELDCRKIIQSRDGLIWIATYGGGVILYNPKETLFNHYLYDPADLQGLRDGAINCFYDAPNGNMWIGTDAGGLHLFQPSNGTFNNFINNQKLKQFDEYSILKIKSGEKRNHLWLGTYKHGIVDFNFKTGTAHHYKYKDQPSYHPSHAIYAIEDYSDSILWLGTNGFGIIEFNKYTSSYGKRHFITSDSMSLSNDYIRVIYRDKNNTMWVGSYGRLNKYLGDGKFRGYVHNVDDSLSIKNGLINAVFEDSHGNFWLGNHGAGLMLMDRASEKFYTYSKSDGLFVNHIYGIIEDEHGVLWLTTNNGLVAAKIVDAIKEKPRLSFKYYYKENGLQDNSFIGGSIYRNSQSQIYVGGQNGFNFFTPDKALQIPNYQLDIYLEDLLINGQTTFLEENANRTKTIEYLDTLLLESEASDIAFNITAINFEIAKKLHYSYKLEGFEKNWNYQENVRRVAYTNLPLGIYKLNVRASLDGSTWINRDKTLIIKVIGSWYQYWYGKLMLAMMAIGIIIVSYINRINIIKKQKIKLQKLTEEQSKEIRKQNNELILRNDQLNHQFEEILRSREEIKVKNEDLEEMQSRLQSINNGLEAKVHKRTIQLNNTIDQLNDSIQKLDSFLSNTSMELDIPLKSMQGFITILKMEKDQEKSRALLRQLDININHIEAIKKQLEDFSINNKGNFNYQKINLYQLTKDVIHELGIDFDLSFFDIQNLIPPDAEIFSDIKRLKIVFFNILSNAFTFYDKSKSNHMVKLFLEENVANLVIHIIDNGIGMSNESLRKIFQMYFKADDKRRGAGLGLFVTKEILTNLKSSIIVNSVQGKQTEIILSFPKVKR